MRFISKTCMLKITIIITLFFTSFILAEEEITGAPKERLEILSIDVRDKPFALVIDFIKEETGKNIIYDPEEIKNLKVTATLVNVHWREILEIIAKEKNCIVQEVGTKVIKISKPPEVTLEFDGADVRDIINQIAIVANKNIVISEQVRGTVSLHLKNVPWQDALNAIIKTRGYVLVPENDGRILRVVPPSEIQTQLETKIFKLKYIRPKSPYVAKMTSNYFKEEKKKQSVKGVEISDFSLLNALNSVVSPKGKITYDDGTNTIIATDIKPKIDKMEQIIKDLDKEPKQVFIDVKFVRTTNTDIFDFGLDIGDSGISISQSFGSMATRLPFTLGRGGFEDAIAAVPESQLEDEGFPNDTNITDTVTEPISFGKLDFTKTQFALRLLKRDVKSKIVQAPKLITLDHHEATIFVGDTIAYAKTQLLQNDNGTSSTELIEADDSPVRTGFQILVIPHVIPGTNKVRLTIIPSNDSLSGTGSALGGIPGFNVFKSGDSEIQLPQLTSQVVVTHMILESGQTAVIGGLAKVSQNESVNKVPLLGDIPFLGYLFKNKVVNKQKEDLFIFVTPRIVQSSENTEQKIKSDINKYRKETIKKHSIIWGGVGQKEEIKPQEKNKQFIRI